MEKKLTNKDLWKIFWNQMTIRTCNNYERQQNAGFTQAMMPAIEKLYDTEEKKQEAYERHMEYFLTNDITSAIPVGIRNNFCLNEFLAALSSTTTICLASAY